MNSAITNQKITIPFCYLPNSKTQEFDTSTSFRSKFQIEQLKIVASRDDFAYFVTLMCYGEEWVVYDRDASCKCPVHVMWYDKAGFAYTGRIGMKKFMDGYTTWIKGKSYPVPLNSVVYTSRCK